jgi:hypothetical protein
MIPIGKEFPMFETYGLLITQLYLVAAGSVVFLFYCYLLDNKEREENKKLEEENHG